MANTQSKNEISRGIAAYLDAIKALAEAIRTGPEDGTPSGRLYAAVCGSFDLHTYTHMIDTLKGAKLVEEHNHLLTWTGPRFLVGERVKARADGTLGTVESTIPERRRYGVRWDNGDPMGMPEHSLTRA